MGVVVIGGMLIAVMLPWLCRSTETGNRVKCGSNLTQIFRAITLYSEGNGGQYPASLATLVPAEDLPAQVMVCPSSSDEQAAATNPAALLAELTAAETKAPGHTHCLSYVYVGQGLTASTVTGDRIIAYEPLNNHDGDGVNVLFGDGHVEFVTKKSWLKVAGDAGIAIDAPSKG